MGTIIRSTLVFTLFSVMKIIGIHIYDVQLPEFSLLSQDTYPDMKYQSGVGNLLYSDLIFLDY